MQSRNTTLVISPSINLKAVSLEVKNCTLDSLPSHQVAFEKSQFAKRRSFSLHCLKSVLCSVTRSKIAFSILQLFASAKLRSTCSILNDSKSESSPSTSCRRLSRLLFKSGSAIVLPNCFLFFTQIQNFSVRRAEYKHLPLSQRECLVR